MRIEKQRDLIREIFALESQDATTMADSVGRIPASHYTCDEHAERERSAWFLGQPSLAGLGVEIPNPGDYLSYEVGGLPILVVRAPDGSVRAYENICRHRAAPLARGCGHAGRILTCPFHGWSYDTRDGSLVAQPKSRGGFESLDRATLGLQPLAAVEHHGLVFVDPRRSRAGLGIDVDAWLAGLADDFESFDYAGFFPFESRSDDLECNWKLLLDTFFESYHVFSLHRESLSAAYPGIASPARGFGPHNRIIVPMASIKGLESQPTGNWELLPHAVAQYFVAPNVIFSHFEPLLTLTRFTPLATNRTRVMQAFFTHFPVTSEAQREDCAGRFAFAHQIISSEDYAESELVHRGLASGRVEHTLIGRNEPGIGLFHAALARMIGAQDRPEPRVSGRA